MNIEHVNQKSADELKAFLTSVPSINDVSDAILSNAIIVKDEGVIIGAVSYERYNKNALIRYFVFKKTMEDEVVISLFNTLEESARNDGVSIMYCVVNSPLIEELFNRLGFEKKEGSKLYIDEELFDLSKNNQAFIMEKQLLLY